jgi:hypothetical protein
MKIPQEILKTALLGLNNQKFVHTLFPEDINSCLDTNQAPHKQFLDALSLYSAYIQAGYKLSQVKNISKDIPKAPQEYKKYCSEDMLILLDMILDQREYALISFYPLFLQILKTQNQILPAHYFAKISLLDKNTLEAFGEMGKWIALFLDENTNQTQIDYLSMTKVQRIKFYESLLDSGDTKSAILFLQNLFDAVTPSQRVEYIQMLIDRNIYSKEFIEFFELFVQNNPKKSKKLQPLLIKLKLLDTQSQMFQEYFEKYFSKIWIKTKTAYRLLDSGEMLSILSQLEFFTTLDESLEFVLQIVPISKWLDMMQIDSMQFLTMFQYAKITYQKEQIFQGWLHQAIYTKDKSLLYNLIDINIPIINTKFIDIFTQEEVFEFVKSHLRFFTKNKISLIRLIQQHTILHQPWSKSFSIAILNELFATQKYSTPKKWTETIYILAPYLHMDAIQWLEENLNTSETNTPLYNLKENFVELKKLKVMYEQINNKKG